MAVLDIIKNRYSVRSYLDKEVEKDKLLQILEAGRLAPSAVNFQPIHFVVITDINEKEKVAEAYSRSWFKDAPVIIIALGDHSKSWKRSDGKDHCDIDVAIAIDHMTLVATELGLGTCWVCAFDAKRCHEILQLPDHLEVVALLPIGYPDGERNGEAKRASMEDFVTWGMNKNK